MLHQPQNMVSEIQLSAVVKVIHDNQASLVNVKSKCELNQDHVLVPHLKTE